MAILSIQSHVVYGYAGNTAAVFPMQRLGREVWAINTVEFSNHTGYGSWKGKVLGGELAEELVAGLEERGVLPQCEAVLSGYMGDAAVGRAITGAVKRVRSVAPKALYCCDPVMGDKGRGFYVKPEIPELFKKELCPLADIITPNQFELEALTGISTDNLGDARRAVGILHEMGPKVILVTSYFDRKAGGEEGISMLASGSGGLYRIDTPELPLGANMAGSGDLTASVFLSHFLQTRDIKQTLERCAASVFGILEKSFLGNKNSGAGQGEQKAILEMLLIQAQEELVNPSHFFEAKKV
jgi:pyridoxine kinase